MDWWDDELCRRLAAAGRHVVRYDHRDTGQSSASPAGAPDYTGADLTHDAVALLDALGIAQAHLVGISAGGGIAQEVALTHPGRVLTLTLMSTSPVGPGAPDRPDLPPPAERARAWFADPPPDPDWHDRDAVIDHIVAGEAAFAGSLPADEAALRALAARVVDRTRDIHAAMTNHWILDGGDSPGRPVTDIAAPTLVVHGTEDPLFPPGHGEALAREIPDAHLLALEGMGHQVPPPELWDVFVAAVAEHTGGATHAPSSP
jgi:pimeloyl-ACP methyl ester carboxylesterase